jgi:hypothetical protein
MRVPEVFIVVLNWNGANDTLACLAFLQACALIFRGRTKMKPRFLLILSKLNMCGKLRVGNKV